MGENTYPGWNSAELDHRAPTPSSNPMIPYCHEKIGGGREEEIGRNENRGEKLNREKGWWWWWGGGGIQECREEEGIKR